ncbi:MAG: deoxyribodipyrimidine photo-lyase [Acidobacteriota bacterium]|nr:deoxyribodipyrimidine photo-lyase [Acidobacteriota bacterium]
MRARGGYVLYWARMNRRVESNHALAHAIEMANSLKLAVLFYEGLACSYPNANDRFHTFLLEGVPGTARGLQALGIGYVFHLRRRCADANDAFYRLAADAAAVVTDDYPVFVASDYNRRIPEKLTIPYFAVDSSCIVPMAHFTKQEYAAYTIRPKIRKVLDECLQPVLTTRVKCRFTGALPALHTSVTKYNIAEIVANCEIDHSVPPSTEYRGGSDEAKRRLRYFLENNLRRYAKLSRELSARATSGLSPYLHFGHISSLEVALAVRDYAAEHKLIVDEFLEQLIVRRELAFNFARFSPSLDSLDALPHWARETLAKHAGDPRDPLYRREQFERAATHDVLWNATQTELRTRGVIHGYYRMYWGKKILEWSATPEEALATMIYLHDRYALDGRDPNTYANILWCFGLHDRPWTERKIFGMTRYMSLEGMKRKTDVDAYIREIA